MLLIFSCNKNILILKFKKNVVLYFGLIPMKFVLQGSQCSKTSSHVNFCNQNMFENVLARIEIYVIDLMPNCTLFLFLCDTHSNQFQRFYCHKKAIFIQFSVCLFVYLFIWLCCFCCSCYLCKYNDEQKTSKLETTKSVFVLFWNKLSLYKHLLFFFLFVLC